jgi:hypothetical protein
MRMSRLMAIVACGALAITAMPVGPVLAATPSTRQCETAWYERQYASLAPGFPTSLSPKVRNRTYKACQKAGRLPQYDRQVELSQRAFNAVAQILEREIRRVSIADGVRPCEALVSVLKPVGSYGRPLRPGDDVEGYAPDSFLPILKYNWYRGPFRLKFGVACNENPYANLWFFTDIGGPYLDEEHADRFPSDDEVKKDPWPRTPVEGPMSTCISWGPDLKNDGIGGEGFIFGFSWSRTNLPYDVRSCYPRALGREGLGKYPFTVVPNLPL